MHNVEFFNFINHNLQNPVLDVIMPVITHLGGFVSLFLICIAVIILSVIFKKDNVKKIACLCLISLLLADGIALILKYVIYEPRPSMILEDVRLLIVEKDPFSFPSGHTTSTCAVLFTLIFKLKNRILDVILILCCFLVAFSRIYCGVHYPIDVVAGAAIGIVSAYFVYKKEIDIWNLLSGISSKFKAE